MDILCIRELFKARVFNIEHPVNIVLVVARAPLTVHLLEVVEVVWIDLVEEPGLSRHCLLHCHEERATDPVDEGASWPLVREWQVEELKNLEEGPETINKPVLVILCNTALDKQ